MSVQRTEDVPWQDYVELADVVMTPYDDKVTQIDENAATLQVATSETTPADDAAPRQATLMFEPGTDATMDAAERQTKPLGDLDVRATEYTVGAERRRGDARRAARHERVHVRRRVQRRRGGRGRRHRRPVHQARHHLRRQLPRLPGRHGRPRRVLRRGEGRVGAAKNGVVIKIVSEAGGRANVDTDGDGTRRQRRGTRRRRADASSPQHYDAGKSLWRVEVEHFTPWDYNWPYGCRASCDAARPAAAAARPTARSARRAGSIIGVFNQTLGERLRDHRHAVRRCTTRPRRVPGYKEAYRLNIPLTGNSIRSSAAARGARGDRRRPPVPADVRAPTRNLTLRLRVGRQGRLRPRGRRAPRTRGPDRLRLPGRVPGAGRVRGQLRPVRRRAGDPLGDRLRRGDAARDHHLAGVGAAASARSAPAPTRSAAGRSTSTTATTRRRARCTSATARRSPPRRSAPRCARSPARTRSAGGTTTRPPRGSRSASRAAPTPPPTAASTSPRPSANRVLQVTPDGEVKYIAGGWRQDGELGDGGPAQQAALPGPARRRGRPRTARSTSPTPATAASAGRAGRHDHHGRRRRRPGPRSATAARPPQASLKQPRGLAVAADGTLYVAETGRNRVRRISPDGRITTAAVGGGDARRRLAAPTSRRRLARRRHALRRRRRSTTASRASPRRARSSTFAGNGGAGSTGNGGPATAAEIGQPYGIDVGPNGDVYFADRLHHVVRRIGPDGIITAFAGTGRSGGERRRRRAAAGAAVVPRGRHGRARRLGADRRHRQRAASAAPPPACPASSTPTSRCPPRTAPRSSCSTATAGTCARSTRSPGVAALQLRLRRRRPPEQASPTATAT